ncbi:nicotinamide riboside transporter PnuC [Micrococcus terreus]|uniref:nicotinamide riboside transporter PnuC n=1 Tax=Micrococcus terreus TaxID=574650 RepID=UPI0021A3F7B2|nr:nicotinamide riboside transporter PnuC [Micrococcus terreus]MCT2088609.1 nicotinamide riboside transporter PnuC [Micrococcus terreus]MDK7701455.1 nicotinamide riboside transporter PnuC [Micrococcus terreus]WOO98156.1 nicotinamide riboside transporter PnuC [Micrococcus terreus]
MDALRWLIDLFNWYIPVGGGGLLVREVVGNVFGLASALGGMRRKVWAWPVGIIGNIILLTVFLSSLFGGADTANLLGQAGRQIMFIAVSIYGWVQWRAARAERRTQHEGEAGGQDTAITPQWAGWKARIGIVLTMIVGTIALTPVFRALGSWEPVWADAWTFVGSLLATYGMAKGWVEFWLIWVAVDVVGVPLLWSAGYYASAFMYLFYGVFTLIGFFVWLRAKANEKPQVETVMPDPTLQ